MTRLLAIPAGRRAKWVVLAVWLIAVVGSLAANLPGKFAGAERNESTSFLPGSAESTKALAATKKLQGSELAPMVVVYRRAGGLTAADRARIARDRRTLTGLSLRNTTPFSPPQFSRDRSAALLIASIRAGDGKSDTILDPVNAVRDRVSGDHGGGLAVKVTRRRRLQRRRDQGLREHQRHAAAVGRRARPPPADPHLPQPDLLADPDDRRPLRGAHEPLDRLGAHRGGASPSTGSRRRSSPCSCSARAPTTPCCSSRATARSCAATRTSTRRWRSRCAPRARRSSPPASP